MARKRGLLVGGPNGSATAWQDVQGAYEQNEIAINWNTAMIFAAASLTP